MPVEAVGNPVVVAGVESPQVARVESPQVEVVGSPQVEEAGTPWVDVVDSPLVDVGPDLNLANTPINWTPGWITGALSAALASPGGDSTNVRGLFSMMALSSGYRSRVLEVAGVRALVFGDGTWAVFLTRAAR